MLCYALFSAENTNSLPQLAYNSHILSNFAGVNERIVPMTAKQDTYRQGVPLLPSIVGSGFGAGFFPYAPGTAGALLAALLWYALSCVMGDPLLKLVTLLLVGVFYVLGVWAANRLSPYWGEDPSRVVIDEIVGTWVSLLVVPAGHLWYCIAAFVLFRFFDIVKPLGIRRMEAMHGGTGVMMDDVLAGIYGFLVLYGVQNIFLPLCD